jgi:hypothetical protein
MRVKTMLTELGDKLARLEGVRQKYESDKALITADITAAAHTVEVLTKASEAIRSILQSLLDEETEGIRALISEGLAAIYDDQEITLRIYTSIKRNKVNLEFGVYDNLKGVEGDILKSFGGGVANIVSLLLRFITIMKMGLTRFMILDESLSNINGEDYIDNTGKFLKTLCAKTGFDVLLLTQQQNPQFINFADHAYVGEIHGSELKLRLSD